MAAVIELDSVTVLRPGKALLQNVTWKVDESERWVVLGPNGAGKTTLMQVVGAQMYPTTGTARILGEKLGAADVFDLRTRIGHSGTVIAERIPPSELVADAVLSAAHAVTGRWREAYESTDLQRATQIIGELGIGPLANRTFGTLSEGERKRTLIARALMTDPELLLLDEPGAGLDLGAREDLLLSLDLLSTAKSAPVMVMVSHHVEEIPTGFTHVLMLRSGQVVAAGPIEETLRADTLGLTFGMRLELEQSDGRYHARRAAFGHRGDPGAGKFG